MPDDGKWAWVLREIVLPKIYFCVIFRIGYSEKMQAIIDTRMALGSALLLKKYGCVKEIRNGEALALRSHILFC